MFSLTKMIEITIPIYNEEESLYFQVQKVLSFIQNNEFAGLEIEIILADNGSTDHTQVIGQDLASKHKCVKYIRTEKPGVGAALKKSWEGSSAIFIGYMDLDLSTNLDHLHEAFKLLDEQDADIISGSRLNKNAVVKKRSFRRHFVSVTFNRIVRAIFKTSFEDGMCGFKFLKRSLIPKLRDGGAVSDGWFFATEILIVGEYLGYKVINLPVQWTDTETSKVKIFKLTFEYLAAMVMLKRKLNRVRISHDNV